MKTTTAIILTGLIIGPLAGVMGWYISDYQQCKSDLDAYNQPILGDDQ